MKTSLLIILLTLTGSCFSQENPTDSAKKNGVGVVTRHHRGLHGYIGYNATRPQDRTE